MMNNDNEYKQALEQAKANLADVRERGEDAIGGSWEDLRAELFTPEEIAASNARVAIMSELIKARNENNITQRELENLSGVKQPIISRMESGATSPQLDTVLKVLGALGKTLYVGDIPKAQARV
jgi:Trp operon repressor